MDALLIGVGAFLAGVIAGVVWVFATMPSWMPPLLDKMRADIEGRK